MADVFISYSQKDREIARSLADFLTRCGYDLWWDYELVGGTRFRQEIKARLESAKAAIVIWTPNSVESDWVIEEAEDAKYSKKLIATRLADLDFRNIPLGFRSVHTEVVTEPERILRALESIGIKPSRAPAEPQQAPVIIDKRLDAEAIAKAEQFAHWEFIKDSKDAAAFSGYIDRFPDSSFASMARIQLGRLAAEAWGKLGGGDNLEALRGFAEQFPLDPRATDARARVSVLEAAIAEAASWARIQDTSDIVEVEAHLSLFPEGSNAPAARAKLQALKRQQEIAAHWTTIAHSMEPADFEAFLTAYPDSPQSAEARTRLEEILRAREEKDWQGVQNAELPRPLLGFLRHHPAGTHAEEALALLGALPKQMERDAWTLVKDADPPILLRGFLAAFPAGAHAAEAEGRLRRLAAQNKAPNLATVVPTPPEVSKPASPTAASDGGVQPATDGLQPSVQTLAETFRGTLYVSDAVALIEALGGRVVTTGHPILGLFGSAVCTVHLFDERREFSSEYDMAQWTNRVVVPKVLS